MAAARYALTVVFDVDFVTGPPKDDSAIADDFETIARDAVENYSTRVVSGTEIVFLAFTRDAQLTAS